MLQRRRPRKPALGKMHVAEDDGHNRGDSRAHPEKAGGRRQMLVLLLAREPFEHKDRNDDADRYVQRQDVKTPEKKDQVHQLLPLNPHRFETASL